MTNYTFTVHKLEEIKNVKMYIMALFTDLHVNMKCAIWNGVVCDIYAMLNMKWTYLQVKKTENRLPDIL